MLKFKGSIQNVQKGHFYENKPLGEKAKEIRKLLQTSDKDVMDLFPFFFEDTLAERNLFVAIDDASKVVGFLSYKLPKTDEDDLLRLSVVSTEPGYKNKGVATALVESVFKLAKKLGYRIKCSSYEPDGLLYLKPKLWQASEKFAVNFLEADI